MNRIIFILLICLLTIQCDGQIAQTPNYIIIPDWFAVRNRNIMSVVNVNYAFDDTIRTKGGRYVCGILNFNNFPVTTPSCYGMDTLWRCYGKVSAEYLPADSFLNAVQVYS